MKQYISILMLICFATFTYAQNIFSGQWKAVTKLENEGLTKSAAEQVEDIYQKAIKENDKPQRIKALLYKSKYMLTLEEDAQINIVDLFKSEIASADTITKHLLENMLANLYWQYFQQNRYKFYDRTTTEAKVDEVDFRTWDLETLFNEIHTYYQRSLQDKNLLQDENLDKYSVLIHEVKNSKDYRPMLYDLLSHNALEFYKTDENSITKPSYKFTIDDTEYITNSEKFIQLNLISKDSLSLQLNALKIYQNLLQFHSKDMNSKAFVAVDIERLQFVLEHATFQNKEVLYLESLKQKALALQDSPLSSLYNFEIAAAYQQQGLRYQSNQLQGEEEMAHRWKLKEALELCNQVISAHPKSDGAEKCYILKQNILQPNLRLQAEEFLPINSPSKLLVTYKNLSALDFKIFKITKSKLEAYNKIHNTVAKQNFLKALNEEVSFSSTLKNEGDYQQHSTEIIIPRLKNGLYLIQAITNTDANVFGVTHFQVTDFALIESSDNNTHNYQLIDRNNGKPIVDAKIEVAYVQNQFNRVWKKSFTTDRYGKFQFEKDYNRYRDIEVKAVLNGETAYFGDYYISQKYEPRTNTNFQYTNFLFTDRSIYRPGQTVYFKGISTERKDEKAEVYADQPAQVRLKNVNGEVLSELSLQTNEFGSVHGEFILPNGGLTGNFSIEMFCGNSGYTYFSVEEYKRPKFKPEFNPVTDTFKVNDSITVNGKAVAFAGSNITDAKVVYRVKRQVQYPSWYYWRRPFFNSEPQEITFGETQTNDKGEFDITFKAIPDESVSKENLPVFRYEVTADVTDINGETRTTTTIVNVGHHTMTVTVKAPQRIDKSKKQVALSINSRNLNGEYVHAKGTITIYKLDAPENVLRTRPWNAPDYQVISKDEFKNLFPHEPYENEDKVTNWKRGKEVFSTTFNTEKNKDIIIDHINRWDSGKYIIVLESKDKFGLEIKDEAFVDLYNHDDKNVADNQLFEMYLNKDSYEAGDIAKLNLCTAAKDITVTVEVEKNNKIFMTQLVNLSDSKQTISIPVLEGDLGGFVVHCSFAAFNSFVSKNIRINVPYPKTDLQIETLTFRDKLQPGQEETWSFKIKGPQGDKVSAELLASMYDASLDEFRGHDWSFNPISNPSYYGRINRNARQSFGTTNFRLFNNFESIPSYPYQNYDRLNWFGLYFGNNYRLRQTRGNVSYSKISSPEAMIVEDAAAESTLDEVVVTGYETAEMEEADSSIQNSNNEFENNEKELDRDNIQIRKNLNETAFFFPQLQTDEEGNVSFNFTAPEALTKWKLQLLAHTKTLESTVTQMETVTQKELMVIPNAPRFLREGDQITISSKIANLTENKLSGSAQLILTNPITGENINNSLLMTNTLEYTEAKNKNVGSGTSTSSATISATKNFSVDSKGNTQVSWNLTIPNGTDAVQYKVIAKAGDFSDGEQSALPVLSNRMLVTETLPMWIRSNETKTFTLDKLKNQNSTTLNHHKLTLEMTSNPAWYAVQALPYLMEYPYDCNEQTFARYYANALAQHIVKSNPKIEAVFNQWASQEALISNLEKNQELKSILIQETPWLRDAHSETEQKKRIGLLFDLNKMNNELQSAMLKLKNNQYTSGAWPWFNGGRDNRYITQHIVGGFGHLKKLNVASSEAEMQMIQRAVQYLDAEFIKEYNNLKKHNENVDLTKDHLSHMQLHYLYVRSFYPKIKASKEVKTVMDYYKNQIKKYWLSRSLYAKGLMALAMNRMDDATTANKIVKSLKENSINSEELGMYWKSNTNSWHWYQAPIETQSLLIEAFAEVGTGIQSESKNLTDVDNMKIWLLKNKQTNRWKTTKATTEAVYALLLQGSDWLNVTDMVDVRVGNKTIDPSTLENVKLEAGTGYYKTSWTGSEIKPEMADVTISKKGDGIAWGAMYWQYFEDLDKITSAETPLQLSKKLFLKKNTDKGEKISEITKETDLKVGDLIRVRIELRTDRNMEFIHLKDMRASGLEPINVLSQYKWQDGLGYYESTKDAATNFFMDYLPKGVYVFEYDLRVNNAGDMSNGISTIQSMYAPEFSSHSEGVRIIVD
ncbi:alpha-2-macroglobulin family protein [Winogradskyella ursingii]|uniref:alpha-2-macroglobulin family protein n=1 Tax=Winogradskyella ursingii TaxID=2686079 RepID=UPI0015C8D9D9|nr:MG2 domain-containing protein [Winogradskyella ursingii]